MTTARAWARRAECGVWDVNGIGLEGGIAGYTWISSASPGCDRLLSTGNPMIETPDKALISRMGGCTLLWLLVACSSAPPGIAAPTGGERIVVDLLDDEFVRVDGIRQPVEQLIYAIRVRCREVDWDPGRLPHVHFRLAAGVAVSSRLVDRLQDELRAAGVRRIEFGTGGS